MKVVTQALTFDIKALRLGRVFLRTIIYRSNSVECMEVPCKWLIEHSILKVSMFDLLYANNAFIIQERI